MLTNCVSDEFNLSEGINTEITIGGDSLSISIGKIKPVILGDMIDSLGVDILKLSEDGGYSIHLSDSLDVKLKSIDPVVVNISPISIADITTTLADIKFPIINFNPVQLTANSNVPVVQIDNFFVPIINSTYTKSTIIPVFPDYVKQNSNQSKREKLDEEIAFGPFEIEGNEVVSQVIPTYVFDPVLKKINRIYFKNNKVTVTFNKKTFRDLGFSSHQAEIVLFKIDYPAEYKLYNAEGENARIVGNSFVIENSIFPSSKDIIQFSYMVDSLDLSDVEQNGELSYSVTIPFSVKYRFSGYAKPSLVEGKMVTLSVNTSAEPKLKDLDIETNLVVLENSNDSKSINETVSDLPIEVDIINSVSFKPGAVLQLKIDDPGIQPFSFTAGNCIVNLPKHFIFKPYTGLNLSTNKLTIPYTQLFGTKSIEIDGINLNKKVVDRKISFTDVIDYSISGLTIGGKSTKLSTSQSLGQKKINIIAMITGLEVSDASVTTNQISIDIPDLTANFSVNKFVSADVKKIYKIGLKSPTQLEFKIDVSKVPTSIEEIFFDNYTITFPESMKFKDQDVKDHQLIINGGFSVSKGYSKTLNLESFDFGTEGLVLKNGILVLNEKVTMTGKAYVKKSTVGTDQLKGIVISPKINVGSMSISTVEGLISQNVDPVSEIINLGFPEMLKNGNNNLDINNPVITLEIANTMGVPLDLNLSLIPRRKGKAIENATISTKLSIEPAANLGEYTFSKFWLAKSNDGVSQGFTAVVLPNLPNLLSEIPDEIEVKGMAVITGTNHRVDLYSPKNELKIKYSINVPMDFGKDFKIQYRDTISDLKEGLANYVGFSKKIDLVAVVKNGIPMDLEFSLVPLDENNNPIKGLFFDTEDKIKSCTIDAKPQTSVITLGIRETEKDAMRKLNAIDFTINASKNSTIAGAPLKADQSVELELRVRIPGGITLKL